MSDELDGSEASGAGEAGGADAGASGRTTVAVRPQRPTGKRSRRQAVTADDDATTTAVELTEDTAETEAADSDEQDAKAKKGDKAVVKKDGKGVQLSRNPVVFPIVFVYNYIKQVVAELRKVIWPNRKQMVTYTSVVLAFLVFMVALIAGADYGFAKLVLLVFGGER